MLPTRASRVNQDQARKAIAIAVFLAAVAYVVLAASPGSDITDARRSHGSAPMIDLRDATWSPVREMLAGENPYAPHLNDDGRQPFVGYLPHHLVLHLPFGLVPLGAAQALVITVTIVTTLVYSARRIRGAARRSAQALVLAGAAIATYPGLQMATLGQTTFEALAGIVLLNRSSVLSRAVGFALVTQKPQIGIPVVVVHLATNGWRSTVKTALPTLLLVFAVCIPLSAAAGGPIELARSFLTGLEEHQDAPGDTLDPDATLRVDASASVARITRSEPSTAVRLLVAVAVTGATAVAARRHRISAEHASALAATLALVAHPYTAPLLIIIYRPIDERTRASKLTRRLLAASWAAASASQFRIGGFAPLDVSLATTAGLIGLAVLAAAIADLRPGRAPKNG